MLGMRRRRTAKVSALVGTSVEFQRSHVAGDEAVPAQRALTTLALAGWLVISQALQSSVSRELSLKD